MHFAINAAAINAAGPQPRTLEGLADVDLLVGGAGARGLTVGGQMPVAWQPSLIASTGKKLEGAAVGAVGLSMRPTLLVKALGQFGMTFQGAAVGASGVRIGGDFDIRPAMGLDLTRRAQASGSLDISLPLVGDIRTVRKVRIDGLFSAHLDAHGYGRRTAAHRPEMSMRTTLTARGSAGLMMGGEGAMRTRLRLVGELGLSGRTYIVGGMTMLVNLRGEGRRYNHVSIEGVMQVRPELRGERAGRPPIPQDYVAAPASRCLMVPRQNRGRHVHDNRRL